MGKWGSTQVEALKHLYEENNVPSDQLVKDKDALDKFVDTLNGKVGGEKGYTDKEVADQLFRLRKAGKLPRLRR